MGYRGQNIVPSRGKRCIRRGLQSYGDFLHPHRTASLRGRLVRRCPGGSLRLGRARPVVLRLASRGLLRGGPALRAPARRLAGLHGPLSGQAYRRRRSGGAHFAGRLSRHAIDLQPWGHHHHGRWRWRRMWRRPITAGRGGQDDPHAGAERPPEELRAGDTSWAACLGLELRCGRARPSALSGACPGAVLGRVLCRRLVPRQKVGSAECLLGRQGSLGAPHHFRCCRVVSSHFEAREPSGLCTESVGRHKNPGRAAAL
mmetsp:Transcript_54783/g.138824  ORF Transcript_54783/g.138824 Transcript_54783/m.138824 type:complete len:258 (+) Transcript_54783:687-1460(+)